MRRRLCILVCIGLGWLHVSAAAGDSCATRAIGVNVTLANSELYAFQCRGQAQTFVADDTLVAAITIWKPPSAYIDRQNRYLFVLGTYAGQPNQFDVLDGPRILSVTSDDTTHHIPYRFVFDPPLALP